MSYKILQVVESAYRATIEEQDDTIIWISHALKNAEGDIHVLLRANAVNYAVKGQDASGLSFGVWKQTQPANVAGDVAKLVEKGVSVYVVQEDLRERGIETQEVIQGVKMVSRREIPGLYDSHDQVWHW